MDIEQLFDSMTTDERAEFITLYLDQLKQDRQASALLQLANACTASALSLLPNDALPKVDYKK